MSQTIGRWSDGFYDALCDMGPDVPVLQALLFVPRLDCTMKLNLSIIETLTQSNTKST